MSRFDTYFLMKPEDAIEYAVEKLDIFDGSEKNLKAVEIGDGNLNYVFRVWDEDSSKSVIIKQAGPELRIAKDFDISIDRNKIEVGMLKIEKDFCPNLVADVYLHDTTMWCFSMEDLSDYQVMRSALMKHEIFPQFAEDITDFMAKTLLLTTDRVMDSKKKKDLVVKFTNPELCADISEPLVYTEPYDNNLSRNKVFPPNLDFVKNEVYDDKALHLEVAKLKYDFMNNAQSLIHGDLHTGSIFIKQGATKVMDPEFGFYGPMGYDIGNVVANMMFAWANGDATEQDPAHREKYLAWVEDVIVKSVDMFKAKYNKLFDENVSEPMAKTPGYKEYFLDTILEDTAGVTGLEINRRVIGMAQVIDITRIADEKKRMRAERIVVLCAKELIKNRKAYKDGSQWLNLLKQVAGEVKV